MRREALALYFIGKIIPSGVLKTTVRLMIKSLFYRRKVGHETCEMDWKAVPRIEIAALWSGGLGRGVSTGGEGDAFLRWSGGIFGTSNLFYENRAKCITNIWGMVKRPDLRLRRWFERQYRGSWYGSAVGGTREEDWVLVVREGFSLGEWESSR